MPWTPSESVREHFLNPLQYSAKVGSTVGLLGFTGGSIYGLFRTPHPYAFGATVGVSGFYYGSSVILVRGLLLEWVPARERKNRSTQYVATGAAGCFSGAVASLWQRAPVWRPSVVICLLSITSQWGYNSFYNRYAQTPDRTPFLERMSKSAWMPLRSIPDEEYESTLKQKIGKLENEITVVESQLAALRQQRDLMVKDP